MTSTPSSAAPEDAAPTGAAPRTAFWDWLLRQDLRRSDERWLGGVAAGTADRLGVDPVLLRVVVVVVSLLGGVGLVVYAAAWLLLPDARDRIEARALVAGEVSAGAILALGLVTAASVVPEPWSWAVEGRVVSGGDVVALVLVGTLLAAVVALLPRLVPASAGGARPDGQPLGGSARSTRGSRRPERPVVPAWATSTALGLALLVGGVTWLVLRPGSLALVGLRGWASPLTAGAALSPSQVVALSVGAGTAVVALALVLAGLVGRRGDGLGFWATSGAVAVLLAAAVPPGADVEGLGGADWRPPTAAQAERGFASWAGETTLDLRAAGTDPAAAGTAVEVELRHGFGRARVVVPDDADVEVRTGGVIGEVVTSGDGWTSRGRSDGFFTSTTAAAPAAGGSPDPVRLVVDARTAVGQLELVRSAS